MMYEVNANGNREYRTGSSAHAADIAVNWKKQGYDPKAYAIHVIDGSVTVREVLITTKRATASDLARM